MPGVTKHIYEADIRDIHAMWKNQLKSIAVILPQNYTEEDVVNLLKEYYPHEWESVVFKKQYYDIKDKFLQKRKGRSRYCMPAPAVLLKSNAQFRKLISREHRLRYAERFDEEVRAKEESNLKRKRIPKIQRIDQKIASAKYQTQSVTPDFLDKVIGLYERKNTSQKDRVYLLIELKKYYNPKVINFFFKLNDTELNKQLREMAFKHLQSFNYQPRLRKQQYMQVHTSNKKRKAFLKEEYPNQTYTVPQTPDELESRIGIGKEQSLKRYDMFVSHSSMDSEIIRKLISYENDQGIFAFCDWMNDSDYLKRTLLCEATLRVLEYRLDKSDTLIFVRTPSSIQSVWCKYEINYFHMLGKPMYVIDGDAISRGDFDVSEFDPKEMLCADYKKLLFEENS